MFLKFASNIILTAAFCLLAFGVQAQIHNTKVAGKIDVEANSDLIKITASAYNKTSISESLKYVLSVIKTDPETGNRSKNDQSGRLVLGAGQKQNLSQTTISANETARIIILLLIYNIDNEIIGKDRVIINGNDADMELAAKTKEQVYVSPDAQYVKADGVELRGIILEETKTRPGREFYRMYTDSYQYYNIDGEQVVLIKETLSIANNTKIEITIGSVKILEFIVRPQNDFLKQLAEIAIKRTNKYFNDLRSGKYTVTQY
ncbi:MAG: hypothetical protein HKN48_00260 [Flavobacteriaceae bacterium]|nr:hypothetical protein [Flavobacteriaceae bacterium]